MLSVYFTVTGCLSLVKALYTRVTSPASISMLSFYFRPGINLLNNLQDRPAIRSEPLLYPLMTVLRTIYI